jgi:ribosomal protein S27AE
VIEMNGEVIAGLVGVGLIPVAWYFIGYNPWAQQHWQSLITQAQYVQKHPELALGERIACYQCGGTERLDLGLLKPTDYRRRIVCARCKSTLWRESA